jgi:hypothetical protein
MLDLGYPKDIMCLENILKDVIDLQIQDRVRVIIESVTIVDIDKEFSSLFLHLITNYSSIFKVDTLEIRLYTYSQEVGLLMREFLNNKVKFRRIVLKYVGALPFEYVEANKKIQILYDAIQLSDYSLVVA